MDTEGRKERERRGERGGGSIVVAVIVMPLLRILSRAQCVRREGEGDSEGTTERRRRGRKQR